MREGVVPLIPVVIWTCGLRGLLPALFIAEIYKQTNTRNQGEEWTEKEKHIEKMNEALMKTFTKLSSSKPGGLKGMMVWFL